MIVIRGIKDRERDTTMMNVCMWEYYSDIGRRDILRSLSHLYDDYYSYKAYSNLSFHIKRAIRLLYYTYLSRNASQARSHWPISSAFLSVSTVLCLFQSQSLMLLPSFSVVPFSLVIIYYCDDCDLAASTRTPSETNLSDCISDRCWTLSIWTISGLSKMPCNRD